MAGKEAEFSGGGWGGGASVAWGKRKTKEERSGEGTEKDRIFCKRTRQVAASGTSLFGAWLGVADFGGQRGLAASVAWQSGKCEVRFSG